MQRLRVLTWHIHGSYLYYLAQTNHDFFLPVKSGHPVGYGGRLRNTHWPSNVQDIPAADVKQQEFDCILFQSQQNYHVDQYEILSASQRQLPKIYLEHDPPRQHPTDTRHPVDDPKVLLVHVTNFNNLMWDSGRTPTCVIEHGVIVPEDVCYTGELDCGLVVVNGLASRGRRLGADIFEQVRQQVPLVLVGMGSEQLGGLGELPHRDLPIFAARYRFLFNPIRYTSLGLTVCEAMMLGLPIVGLATTEMVTAVEPGCGYLDTKIERLVRFMQGLLNNPKEAKRLGARAAAQAQKRFSIQRFARDWDWAFAQVTGRATAEGLAAPAVEEGTV